MLKLKDAMRAGHVTRWQIVRTARHQTLAEHSYLVALIAQHIYGTICPLTEQNQSEELTVLRWALRHDLPEVMTGDIATPMKRRLRQLVEYDPFDKIERNIDPEYGLLRAETVGTSIGAIVKVADMQEGIVFLHTEGIGPHAKKVKEKLIERHRMAVNAAHAIFRDWSWEKCFFVLDDLLHGDDGMMDIEDESQ